MYESKAERKEFRVASSIMLKNREGQRVWIVVAATMVRLPAMRALPLALAKAVA
jgi:hypothetical protein